MARTPIQVTPTQELGVYQKRLNEQLLLLSRRLEELRKDVDALEEGTTIGAHNIEGASHTAAGLTTGDVLTATATNSFVFQAPASVTPLAHPLVGALHTVSGLTLNHVLQASGTNTYKFDNIPSHALISGHTATGLTTNHVLQATATNSFGFAAIPSHTHLYDQRLTTITTTVGNVGSGEDNLMTYSVPAGTLATNGQTLRVMAFFTNAANGNTKTIKAYFGATSITLQSAAVNNGVSWVELKIVRTGATSQLLYGWLGRTPAFVFFAASAAPAETLSGAVTLKFTGEATSNDDIIQNLMVVTHEQ